MLAHNSFSIDSSSESHLHVDADVINSLAFAILSFFKLIKCEIFNKKSYYYFRFNPKMEIILLAPFLNESKEVLNPTNDLNSLNVFIVPNSRRKKFDFFVRFEFGLGKYSTFNII